MLAEQRLAEYFGEFAVELQEVCVDVCAAEVLCRPVPDRQCGDSVSLLSYPCQLFPRCGVSPLGALERFPSLLMDAGGLRFRVTARLPPLLVEPLSGLCRLPHSLRPYRLRLLQGLLQNGLCLTPQAGDILFLIQTTTGRCGTLRAKVLLCFLPRLNSKLLRLCPDCGSSLLGRGHNVRTSVPSIE
ncbi:hypothetical protein SAMN05216532_8190 [Streptomyces sp. 2231.1]|nr:hypothetical protein SAMN05216532_8190 [Streptomyces sp. 2231.1]